jgi:hypothetical protein
MPETCWVTNKNIIFSASGWLFLHLHDSRCTVTWSRMIYLSSNYDRHPVAKTITPLHYICRDHFFPFKLHPTALHYTSLPTNLAQTHLNSLPLHFTSHHYTSPHFTTLHLTSLHFTSLHYTSLHCTFRRCSPHIYYFHFIPFIIAFLTL